jgi:hypothetical protein
LAITGQGQARRNLGFTLDDLAAQYMGASHQASTGHLLGVAHQLVEVNFGTCHERSDAAATFDNAFVFQGGQRVPGGHQANLMDLGEVSLGRDGVAGAQLPRFNALANDGLNSLVGGNAIPTLLLLRHSISGGRVIERWPRQP